MDVCLLWVLSGRGLCDGLVTCLEESYLLWCVVVCDQEKLVNEEALAHWGLLRQKEKKYVFVFVNVYSSDWRSGSRRRIHIL
jgi:hypothetical protein